MFELGIHLDRLITLLIHDCFLVQEGVGPEGEANDVSAQLIDNRETFAEFWRASTPDCLFIRSVF